MKIREMQLLKRVAETGSMTLSAQQMHLTPAAVSAAIRRIEERVGVRLFERTTRSLHPTDEGLLVIAGCEEVIERWQRTLDEARGQREELEGLVHLSAPTDTSYQVLEAVVAELCAEHPALKVVMSASDTVHHLHREAIDLAVRFGPLRDSTLSARRLAELPRILVASPSYLARMGVPQSPKDLVKHRCITLHLANAPTVSWQLQRGEETEAVPLDSPLCGDGFMARRWAVAGMGIAFKSLFDVIDDLEAGRLVCVMPEYTGGSVAIHTVFPSRRYLPARVHALANAIAERCQERSARCEAWLQLQV